MDDLRRAEITVEKTQHRLLPVATDHASSRAPGDGTTCDGCDEAIGTNEDAFAVCVGGVLILVFHDPCYGAWRRFRAA